MRAEIMKDTDPLRMGTAEGDGKSLKLFLAAEIVRIGQERVLSFADVAAMIGMTEPEFERLIQGGYREAEVWTLFTILKMLGAVVVVGVDRAPNLDAGVVLWSRLSLADRAARSAEP
jgi:predicted XRE-type DNA-binding protein